MDQLTLQQFDYELPSELIAQTPSVQRDQSRLMVLNRATQDVRHARFADLGTFLSPGDLLVLNRSRVIPARLTALRTGGGRTEILLLNEIAPNLWRAMVRPARKLQPGLPVRIAHTDVIAVPQERGSGGEWTICLQGEGDVRTRVLEAGTLPLPPYIHGSPDTTRYQTVYADRDGSVAAPTAGLHFTAELLQHLRDGGVSTAFVTLHVGAGTFKPVTTHRVTDHVMHSEWGEVPLEVAEAVNRTRAAGCRVVAVGTTTTRLLEAAASDGNVRPFSAETDIFIYPGYHFRAIDALVTNFHLPKSTLLMLVSALAGRDFVLDAYRQAIAQKYRFFSFGDAMLIL